jgi:hypothetical protein
MGVLSINEPSSEHRTSMLTPPSINEPPQRGEGGELTPPRATGMDPTGCAIGDPVLTLTVFGTDFTPETLIVFDDVPSITDYVDSTELNTSLNPAAFTEAGGHPVTVQLGSFTAVPAMMFTVSDIGQGTVQTRDEFQPMHGER